ncbi:MAG: hypothetical protein K8R88_04980, partial [Armatimonadetes bacterium]|nr:hypothetical protein [Armatimonadota bacterium]
MRRTIKPKLSDLDSVEIEATPTPAPAPAKKPTRAATPKKAVAEVAVPEKPNAAPKKVVAKAPAKKSTPKPTVKSDLQDEVDAIAQEYVPTFRAPAKKTAASSTAKDVNKEEAQPEVKGRRARVEKPKPSPVVNEEPYVEWIKPEFVKLTAKEAIAAVEGDLPVPIWRPKSDSPPQQHEDSEESTGNLAPRRNRNKRRGEENPVTAADALQTKQEDGEGRGRRERPARKPREVAFKEPVVVAPPAPTVRALIPIPEDAPQIIKKDGHLILVRNKTAIPPIFFFGTSPDENRLNTVLEEIKHAAENGVRVFTHLVELDVEKERVKDAVSYAAFMLKKTLEIAPDAQLLFRVVFTAQPGWERRFAKARFAPQGGGLAEPSFADDEFWSEAEGCLREFCGMLRQLDQKDSVLGVQLERGEWFFADGWGYDTSPAAVEKFREWLRVRYRGEIVAMRASWFDGQVQFDTAVVPPYLP